MEHRLGPCTSHSPALLVCPEPQAKTPQPASPSLAAKLTALPCRLCRVWDSWPGLAPARKASYRAFDAVPATSLSPCAAKQLNERHSLCPPLWDLPHSLLGSCTDPTWDKYPEVELLDQMAPFPGHAAVGAPGQCTNSSQSSVCLWNSMSDLGLPCPSHLCAWDPCTCGTQVGLGPACLWQLHPVTSSSNAGRVFRHCTAVEISQHTHCALVWAKDDGGSVFPQKR